MLHMRRDGLLAHMLHQCRELHRQPLLALLLADERAPQHADALADHRDIKLVLVLEKVDDLLESGIVVELETVPERPFSLPVFLLRCEDGLREAEERQSQVDESVLV